MHFKARLAWPQWALRSGTRCVGKINTSLSGRSLSADWAAIGISDARSKVSERCQMQWDRQRERETDYQIRSLLTSLCLSLSRSGCVLGVFLYYDTQTAFLCECRSRWSDLTLHYSVFEILFVSLNHHKCVIPARTVYATHAWFFLMTALLALALVCVCP